MRQNFIRLWPLLVIGLCIAAILWFTLRPYGGHPSALFHLDATIASVEPLPPGFVVLRVPGYDGAQYYQVARNIPKIMRGEWSFLREHPPMSYAYQRFLLPLSAWLLAMGNNNALPWTFLCINIAALLGTAFMIIRSGRPALTAIALALSPAAMVALHFSLAEPLVLLLLTAVLLRVTARQRFDALTIALLCLLAITREINLLLILLLIAWTGLHRRWGDLGRISIALAAFLGWHTILFWIFGDFPFLTSAAAHQWPGSAILRLVIGLRGYSIYTLSAIALSCGLIIPSIIWAASDLLRQRRLDLLPVGTLAFLGLMLIMPDYIWGSITSIGRVITPVYPFLLLHCAERTSRTARLLTMMTLVLGLGAGIGLALIEHPFHFSL